MKYPGTYLEKLRLLSRLSNAILLLSSAYFACAPFVDRDKEWNFDLPLTLASYFFTATVMVALQKGLYRQWGGRKGFLTLEQYADEADCNFLQAYDMRLAQIEYIEEKSRVLTKYLNPGQPEPAVYIFKSSDNSPVGGMVKLGLDGRQIILLPESSLEDLPVLGYFFTHEYMHCQEKHGYIQQFLILNVLAALFKMAFYLLTKGEHWLDRICADNVSGLPVYAYFGSLFLVAATLECLTDYNAVPFLTRAEFKAAKEQRSAYLWSDYFSDLKAIFFELNFPQFLKQSFMSTLGQLLSHLYARPSTMERIYQEEDGFCHSRVGVLHENKAFAIENQYKKHRALLAVFRQASAIEQQRVEARCDQLRQKISALNDEKQALEQALDRHDVVLEMGPPEIVVELHDDSAEADGLRVDEADLLQLARSRSLPALEDQGSLFASPVSMYSRSASNLVDFTGLPPRSDQSGHLKLI